MTPNAGDESRESAQALALRALAFLVRDSNLRRAFLAQSGLDPAAVRARAAEPEFLAGVLDFLLGDERHLTRFCAAEGIAPERPARARRLLPGGARPGE